MDNLFILLLVPVVGALVSAFIKNSSTAKMVALVVGLLNLGLCIPFLTGFEKNSIIQFTQFYPWISNLGINFSIGLDGINILFVLLTNLLVPIIILTSFHHNQKGGFYALILAMQAGMLTTFLAFDAFLFYVGWEVALIPIYFINALWGGENKVQVNIKFFIYTFLGSLFMLLSIIYLYTQSSADNFSYMSFYNTTLDPVAEKWVFLGFFLAFAIKLPIFPFHTWQPDTYTVAPSAGTMLLSGIMLKMGGYGLIRWLIPLSPHAFADNAWWIIILCIIGILYASLIAFKLSNAKRLIAYSSIAHIGLISAGVFVWNIYGLQGAIIQMFNHGISVVGLFFIVDMLERRTGTLDIKKMGGIAKNAPILATSFLIILMGSIGLPLTNGFIGEFLLLNGLFQASYWYAIFGGFTIILGAVYMLRMYQYTMLGTLSPNTEKIEDAKGSEIVILAVLVTLVILIGVYPQPLLDLSEPAVYKWMDWINIQIGR